MTESQHTISGEGPAGAAPHMPGAPSDEPARPRWSRVIWAGFAAAFLGFILVGSVPARIWRLGTPHIESKSIARTWMVQLDHLPDVRFQRLVEASFVAALLIFVVAVVVCFWLLLAPDRPSDPDQAKQS